MNTSGEFDFCHIDKMNVIMSASISSESSINYMTSDIATWNRKPNKTNQQPEKFISNL